MRKTEDNKEGNKNEQGTISKEDFNSRHLKLKEGSEHYRKFSQLWDKVVSRKRALSLHGIKVHSTEITNDGHAEKVILLKSSGKDINDIAKAFAKEIGVTPYLHGSTRYYDATEKNPQVHIGQQDFSHKYLHVANFDPSYKKKSSQIENHFRKQEGKKEKEPFLLSDGREVWMENVRSGARINYHFILPQTGEEINKLVDSFRRDIGKQDAVQKNPQIHIGQQDFASKYLHVDHDGPSYKKKSLQIENHFRKQEGKEEKEPFLLSDGREVWMEKVRSGKKINYQFILPQTAGEINKLVDSFRRDIGRAPLPPEKRIIADRNNTPDISPDSATTNTPSWTTRTKPSPASTTQGKGH